MSVSRNSSMRALKQMSAAGRQVRQLHITGAASSSRLLTTEKPAASRLPRDLAGLQAECMRRNLVWIGTEAELAERINIDNARSMSTQAGPRRPVAATEAAPKKQTRHINTSRALKAPKDSSTIDFAFLPEAEDTATVDNVRVPMLGNMYVARGLYSSRASSDEGVQVHTPIISTAALDSTHHSAPSALADVHDNAAAEVDFHAVHDALSNTAQSVAETVKATVSSDPAAGSTIKKLWNGVVDDVFGQRKVATT